MFTHKLPVPTLQPSVHARDFNCIQTFLATPANCVDTDDPKSWHPSSCSPPDLNTSFAATKSAEPTVDDFEILSLVVKGLCGFTFCQTCGKAMAMTVKLWNLLTCISLSGSFLRWSIGVRVLQGRAMKKGDIMLMSAQVCIALVSVAAGADPPFEGTKAGDVRELAPGIVFRWCPAGTFMMGENRRKIGEKNRQAEVTLTSGFWLGETEVTQGQWSQFMESSPWSGKDHVKEGPDFAASCISHDDAVSFCEKLTTQQRNAGTLPKDWKYSLPTDAQWEYGCRAGTKTTYSFGDDESQLGEYGWFSESALETGERYAHKVGQKKPNAW